MKSDQRLVPLFRMPSGRFMVTLRATQILDVLDAKTPILLGLTIREPVHF
jgi:hypothetical protein